MSMNKAPTPSQITVGIMCRYKVGVTNTTVQATIEQMEIRFIGELNLLQEGQI